MLFLASDQILRFFNLKNVQISVLWLKKYLPVGIYMEVHKGTFWSDRDILYFYYNGDFRGVYSISQILLNYILKMNVFCGR